MNGILKIRINGLNVGKILNELMDNDIYLKNVREKTKSVSFEIGEENEIKLKEICKKYKKKYEIISRNNLINLLKKVRYYFGFVVAIILISALIFSYNFRIQKVNIYVNSDSSFDLIHINKLLSDNGIVSGVEKKKINTREIEKLILQTQDNIAGCSVKQNGGILDIVIYPGTLNEEVNKENIYSKYNAVITDVQIYAGKSDLKKGDVVQVGDLLIENDNGAYGKIMAKIYYSDFIIYNENQFIKRKTGNKFIKKEIFLFNKNLLKSKQNNTFSKYLEEKCVFCVSKNTFIPINYVKTIYEEFEYESVVVKFEELEEKLKQNLLETVKQNAIEKKITNVTYSVVQENNLTRLDCFVECEIDLLA